MALSNEAKKAIASELSNVPPTLTPEQKARAKMSDERTSSDRISAMELLLEGRVPQSSQISQSTPPNPKLDQLVNQLEAVKLIAATIGNMDPEVARTALELVLSTLRDLQASVQTPTRSRASQGERQARDSKIVELSQTGKSQQQIALELSMSRSTVQHVLRKHTKKSANRRSKGK